MLSLGSSVGFLLVSCACISDVKFNTTVITCIDSRNNIQENFKLIITDGEYFGFRHRIGV